MVNGKQTYSGDHFPMYTNIESLCSSSETNLMLYLNCASIKNKIKTKYNKKQSKANVSLITTLPLHETLLCSSRPDSSAHEAPWVLAPGYRSSGLGRPRLFQSDLQFPQKCTTLYNSKLLHICSLSLKGSPPPPLDSRTGCGD